MEWTITHCFTPARHIVMKVSGRFTVDECRRGIEELAPVKDPLTPLLFDDRAVDFGGLSDVDLMRIGAVLGEYEGTFAYAKIAVLVDGEQAHGLADKWRRVTKGATKSLIAVFDDETEAVAWLTGKVEHNRDQPQHVPGDL